VAVGKVKHSIMEWSNFTCQSSYSFTQRCHLN